jgi:hypothetical protein
VKKSFNVQELLHRKSKTSWNQAHPSTPPPPELPEETKNDLKHHPGSVDLISTKQNKQTTFASS